MYACVHQQLDVYITRFSPLPEAISHIHSRRLRGGMLAVRKVRPQERAHALRAGVATRLFLGCQGIERTNAQVGQETGVRLYSTWCTQG